MRRPDSLSLLLWTLGCGWLLLGILSDNTPVFDDQSWMLFCAIAALSAFALERYRTERAMRANIVIVGAIAMLRSGAYISAGAYNPAAVWLIVLVLNLIVEHTARKGAWTA